ncbi:hypothetical protein V8C86DRAFT_220731 [Haematococcus lacustris]
MGWVSFTLGQVALTSTALGALKRHGIITIRPDVLKNDTARTILVQALYYGEGSAELLEKLGYQAYALVQATRQQEMMRACGV